MNTRETKLKVAGMSCGSCVAHVREALAIAGVTQVDVRLRDGIVAVTHDERVARNDLVTRLQAAGYSADSTTAEERSCCCG
jgi:copper chaperone CopZ